MQNKSAKNLSKSETQKKKVNYLERFKSRRVFDSGDAQKRKSDIKVVKIQKEKGKVSKV